MGQRILALELCGDTVRGALAERTWNTIELIGVYERERARDEPDLAGAIARLVDESGVPDVVVCGLPGEFVAKRLLELPFADGRRLRQVVPFALEEHLPFAVDDAAVAFTRVGRGDAGSLVLAAFARKEDLRHHLTVLAKAGLDPKTVTLGTLALANLLARARNGREGAHLVVDIDHASTSMVLIDGAGTPRALRTVRAGINLNNGSPLPQQAAVAILGAVRQTLLAHASDHDQADIVLTGSAAAATAVRAAFTDALEVPVRDVNEFDYSTLIQGVKSGSFQYASCIAMLLGEAPSRPLELLNFRQGEFAFRGRVAALGPLRVPAILAAVAAALMVLHLALGISTGARKLHILDREIATVTAPALGDAPPSQAHALLQERIVDLTKRLHLLGGNLGHGSPLDVLLALSRAVPSNLSIQFNDVEMDDSGVRIEGIADSYATVDQVKRALERSNYFKQIQVDHATAGTDPAKVDFRLSASLKDSVGGMD